MSDQEPPAVPKGVVWALAAAFSLSAWALAIWIVVKVVEKVLR